MIILMATLVIIVMASLMITLMVNFMGRVRAHIGATSPPIGRAGRGRRSLDNLFFV